MSEYLLQTVCLTKKYGRQNAVDSLSLNIKKGSIYGLIGRNGAGKTTFVKMISGLAKPTSGDIKLFGDNSGDCGSQQCRIGALIEAPGIYDDMTAFDNMKMKAIAMGVYNKEKINELLTLVGLAETGRKKAGKFSLGMKQRLGIAMSMIGTPDLLILDEPINGLDPQGIIEIRNVIAKLNREYEITIIISSHILDELARIATHYAIINEGRLVLELPKEELLARCTECIEIKSDEIKDICVVLEEMGFSDYEVYEDGAMRVNNCCDKVGEINMEIAKRGISIRSISVRQESLEEFFVNITGEAAK
ncbi:MAG: ABC transporter ATP-binding protein [Acutalibacteraceae bacterium]